MKYLPKTIEYGLYLLVFLLPIQTRWIIKAGGTEYLSYSLYGTDILLILLLLLFVAYKFSIFPGRARTSNSQFINNFQLINFKTKCKSPVWWFVNGLVLVSAISVLFAADKWLALYKLGWLILGVGLFWLIVSASYDRLKLIYAVLAGLFLQSILGIWQFLTQSSFANKWLGLALHNGTDLGTSVIEAVGADGIGERWLRAYGGLDHPNMLGGVLAVGILLVIGRIITMERKKNFQFSLVEPGQAIFNAKIFEMIVWIFLIVFTAALFFSFSRSAWLGLAVGLVIMMIIAVVKRNLKLQKSLAEIILVIGVVLFVLFSQYQNLITSRLGGEGRLEEKSTFERLISYQESCQIIKNNWASGVGRGNYTLALSRQIPGRESFYYQPTHNVFLLVLSETGIVGLLFFVALLFVIASDRRNRGNLTYSDDNQRLLRRCASRNDSINGGTILIALVVMMTFDHWLFSLHFGVLFFWLVLGIVASSKRDEMDTEKNSLN